MWNELMVTLFEVVRGVFQEPLTSAGYFLGEKGLSGVFPWLHGHYWGTSVETLTLAGYFLGDIDLSGVFRRRH